MLTRIGLCDADQKYMQCLEQIINSNREFQVAFQARNTGQLLAFIPIEQPGLIIVDVNFPLLNDKFIIHFLKEDFPFIHYIVTLDSENDDRIFNMLLEGADGFLLKTACAEVILEGIKEVSQGRACLSQTMLNKLVTHFKTDQSSKKDYHLSVHEIRILQCLVKGDSYKMISDSCSISMGTVRYHINHLYKKLHINSKSEAVAKALLEHLTPPVL
jgi:DNA-binding NarL/FixJ family response regulator